MAVGLACGVIRGYRESSGSWRQFCGRSPVPHSEFGSWEVLGLRGAQRSCLTWCFCFESKLFFVWSDAGSRWGASPCPWRKVATQGLRRRGCVPRVTESGDLWLAESHEREGCLRTWKRPRKLKGHSKQSFQSFCVKHPKRRVMFIFNYCHVFLCISLGCPKRACRIQSKGGFLGFCLSGI